jgi:hypothetical protein
MMLITFLPEAKHEMKSAAIYYEQQSQQLGKDFLLEIKLAIQKIQTSPTRWQKITGKVRRYLIRRFPYCIYYSIEPKEILIIAVAHLKRKPNYWKNRVPK